MNSFYARIPDVVEDAMARLGERTGRRRHIVDYTGLVAVWNPDLCTQCGNA